MYLYYTYFIAHLRQTKLKYGEVDWNLKQICFRGLTPYSDIKLVFTIVNKAETKHAPFLLLHVVVSVFFFIYITVYNGSICMTFINLYANTSMYIASLVYIVMTSNYPSYETMFNGKIIAIMEYDT